MSLTNQFATDSGKEQSGVTIQYGENADKTIPSFTVSRMAKGNKRYSKAMERATKPYRRQIDLGTMPDDVAERLFLEVFVTTILLGWQNVPLSDVTGNKKDKGYADFNTENATALLGRLPELYEDLQEKSKAASLFREESLEDEAKN